MRAGKKKTWSNSNVPSSFFKVMIGRDFPRVLYLPPKFGPTASTLVNKEAIIEDSSGKQWTVQISIVNNSYAFHEGWEAFSSDHGLEVGHFLVFNYLGRLHFVVKVYDKSGCEKTDFPNQRKQKKRKTITIDSDELLNRQGFVLPSESDTRNTQSHDDEFVGINEEKTSENSNCDKRIRSSYEDDNYDDPCYLIDRDLGDKDRKNKDSPMFDAFWYEILNNSDVHGTNKLSGCNEIVVASTYNEDPLLEEMLVNGANQDLLEVQLTERHHFLEDLDMSTFLNKIPEHLLIPCTMKDGEIKENSETQQLLKEGYPSHANDCENPKEMFVGLHVSLDVPMSHGENERMIQNELMDMTPDLCSYNDQIQTLDGDQSSDLNLAIAESSDYAARDALLLAPISEINSKDDATGGAPEETMAADCYLKQIK